MNLIQTILEQVESNRPQKTRTYIKRTKETKKEKKQTKDDTKETNKRINKIKKEEESDNDIPKYI